MPPTWSSRVRTADSPGFAVMMLLLSVLVTLAPPVSALSSPPPVLASPVWIVTQGGPHSDVGWGVTTDEAGAVYYVGTTTVPGPLADIFVTKVDSGSGGRVWNVTYDGGGDDAAYQVVWSKGMIYVGGRSLNESDHTLNMLVQAYNATDGRLLWSTMWENSPGAGYHEVDGIVLDGAYLYAAGWAAVPGHSEDVGLLKLDASTGQLQWSRTWGTPGWDEANGDIILDSARVYVAGRYNSPNLLYEGRAVVASFQKSDGSYVKNVTWWEGSGESDFLGMAGDSGYLYPVGISATTGDRIILQKYDHNLNLVWATSWEGAMAESSRMARMAPDGKGIIVAGQTRSYGNGSGDALLLGFGQDGNLLWSDIWGGSGADDPRGLEISGNYAYVSGQTTSFGAGSQDAFLAKFLLTYAPATTTSSTSVSPLTTTSSSSSFVATSSKSTSSSSSSTSNAPGVPEFPLQLGVTLVTTVSIALSYLLAKRFTHPTG